MLHSQPETFQDESAGLLADNYKDCAQKPSPKERPAGAVRGVPIPYSGDSAARDEAIVAELARTVNDIKSRRGNWSGICVLARSNPQAAAAAEKLASLNIPVITENSLALQDNPLVAQTLAILTFLANPVDDVAFWSVLNGAVFLEHPEVASALDRNALNDWAAKRRDEPLFRAFQRDFPEIWKKIFQPFYTILTRDEESSKNGALLAAPYDIVMEWRRRMDIERRFPSDEIFSRSFLEAVYTAEQNDYRTLPEFLEFWAEKGADAKAPMPAHMDAVRIMTIHKAKGLAAPVVIVPWTKYPTDPKSEIRSMNIDGLVIPYNAGLKSIGKPFYKKRGAILAENINLLYVAFTRAEEELWFFVPEKEDAKEKKNREKGENKEHGKETSAGGLEEALREAGFSLPLSIGELEKKSPDKTAKKPEEPSGPAPEPEDGTPSQTEIFNDDWRPMDWMPSLRVARKPAGEEGFSASARGEFLHYCMERMKFDGDPREDAENALQAGFANCEDAPPDKAELRSSLLEPLLWFRSIPQAPEWLKEGIFEQSLINEDGEVLRMDLLAPSESGYIIIDLKTGDEYPEHREQIETYIRLLKKIYPGKEIGGKLVYVDKQIIVAV
ncbi:MAG: hypothetical protein K2H64_06035, partial [Desulfovibrio sp.]|nr:hypothetical protein [Desulfovibrio sp.]